MTLGEALDLLASRGLLDRARVVQCGEVRLELGPSLGDVEPLATDPEFQPRCSECACPLTEENLHARVPGTCKPCGTSLLRGEPARVG